MSVISKSVEIVNRLGLHARAAAKLVRVTSQFECTITLGKNGLETDGKSILGMMSLAAGQGTQLSISCNGVDAEEAMDAITECIANRFGEDE